MKLSHNMLNFLGYVAERVTENWCDRRMAIALAYPFGVKSALKNGLIEERSWTIELPKDPARMIPGCPYGRTTEGYALTELGQELAAIGMEQRNTKDRGPDWWTRYVERAQKLLDERQAA